MQKLFIHSIIIHATKSKKEESHIATMQCSTAHLGRCHGNNKWIVVRIILTPALFAWYNSTQCSTARIGRCHGNNKWTVVWIIFTPALFTWYNSIKCSTARTCSCHGNNKWIVVGIILHPPYSPDIPPDNAQPHACVAMVSFMVNILKALLPSCILVELSAQFI